MIELLIVTKSKDPSGNNYSFAVQIDSTKEELEKLIFSTPLFPLRWDSGVAYISTSDISICRISESEENQTLPTLETVEDLEN